MMNPEKMISRRYIDPPDSNLGGSCWNRHLNIQCFFRFWIVNLNVPWTWFHKILRSLYFWPEWTFKTAQRFDRSWSFLNVQRSWSSNVPDCFCTYHDGFRAILLIKKSPTAKILMESSCKLSGTVTGQERSWRLEVTHRNE